MVRIFLSVLLVDALAAGSATCFAEAPASTTPSDAVPACEITLIPWPARPGETTIAWMGVELKFDALRLDAGVPLVQLPLIADNVDTVATSLSELQAHDEKGALRLTSRDIELPTEAARDSETGGKARAWFADRAPQGRIEIHYRVPAMASLPPRGPAPPLSFRNDAEGVSASGNIFLLMPPGTARYAVTTRWDLSHLKPGAIGVSSLGEGLAKSGEPMSSAQLRESYFMAGAIHRWPPAAESQGFFSAWQGEPSFDATALMKWTQSLQRDYSRFFGEPGNQPYGVFMRYNPVNAGGGTGLYHSFILTYGAGMGGDPEYLKSTLAHETFHTFQPYISVPAGKESSWFAEGLAVLYEAKLPLRYGLITPSSFLLDLNVHASRYYSSIMARLPNSEIADRFWDDTRVRTLPYDRGMLYFAVVDDAVRKKSGGKHSLDLLLTHLLWLENQGVELSNKDWESELHTELGDGAVAEFREFLGGKMPLPASDAFGPCFTRVAARARRYELGFAPAVLREPTRIIRDLVPGSAADRAGLKNGDEIIHPVPQDEIQGNQTELIKLDIRRRGQEFAISYLPRGEEVDIYQWVRTAGVPDSQCGL